ncbi:MAG: hypothetical protein VW683_10310 [Betaproteobacteria bacterium]|jgi:hypothetical protein
MANQKLDEQTLEQLVVKIVQHDIEEMGHDGLASWYADMQEDMYLGSFTESEILAEAWRRGIVKFHARPQEIKEDKCHCHCRRCRGSRGTDWEESQFDASADPNEVCHR